MTSFRVTQNMIVGGSTTRLQGSLSRLAELQEQLSSGRRLNRPSDSPTDTAQAMRLRGSLSSLEQYSRNAADGASRLGLADQALTTSTELVAHARELGLQGANAGSSSPASRAALATELDQVRASLLDQANTTYLSRPLFGGVTNGEAAYDDTGTYVGTPGEVTRRVGENTRVRVDVDGRAVFGDGATSVFTELDDLANALRAGDDAGITAGLQKLAGRLDTIGTAHADLGAAQNRVDRAQDEIQDNQLDLTSALTDIENIDLPRTMIDINMQEVAYQAALAATARVVQPSLVDFLR
jgi:flagellar hook-associated protein 3 FlgL